jgi:phosphoenolpyruvate carboxylase
MIKNQKALQSFNEEVAIKYQLYNSLFLSLPFQKIENTGLLLSMLNSQVEKGLKEEMSPIALIDNFFAKNGFTDTADYKMEQMINFVRYCERQVVLFDAIEDAAYTTVNDLQGQGTLKQLATNLPYNKLPQAKIKEIEDFAVRLVLTAHPTQFYPGSVLGIINDMAKELKANNATAIHTLLKQLGKTPFLNKEKPTPYDEAMSLVWYLENVFYDAISQIVLNYKAQLPFLDDKNKAAIIMGFWPGGDRDGNPFVTYETTIRVADALKNSILRCYYRDVKKLKRRLTFRGLDSILNKLEKELQEHAYSGNKNIILNRDQILEPLEKIKEIVLKEHDGIFLAEIEDLIDKVYYFGIQFAFIDIRQESEVHSNLLQGLADKRPNDFKNYNAATEAEKITILSNLNLILNKEDFENPLQEDVVASMQAMSTIQQSNGHTSCHRYIISQCQSALHVLEVYNLMRYSTWREGQVNADIVPLFETIEDLKNAPTIMEALYTNSVYAAHLSGRNKTQTIMLGFSDGTKDGGYLMANYGIYKAKVELSEVAKKYGINVMFFDGRGGPPARGGGKTHKFYASLGNNISDSEIQLTIQGQTISSNFGTVDSAKFNIEQLVNAGVSNIINSTSKSNLTAKDQALIFSLAEYSLEKYLSLRNTDDFIEYLSDISPLKYFGQTNIGSRPAKRGKTEKLSLKDLRAIPFVASWNMIKQNVPGFYGLGTALKKMETLGRFSDLQDLYKRSLFIRTLIDNSEMALAKSFFTLTAYLKNDKKYGPIWNIIKAEYDLTIEYILKLSGNTEIMQEYPVDKLSIQMREKIVLPLITIQQYALSKLREIDDQDPLKAKYEKLVVRTSFGIINAGRNSA